MTEPVTFKLAKLLKEKEFDEKHYNYYRITGSGPFRSMNHINHNDDVSQETAGGMKYITAPTIAEVIMWIYEKHGIWIYSVKSKYGWLGCVKDYSNKELKTIYTTHSEQMFLASESDKWYTSPTESYEAAIEYTLKNLI